MAQLELSVSPAAATALRAVLPHPDSAIRLTINARFEHDLALSTQSDGDEAVKVGDLTLVIDPESATRAAGVQIDYAEGAQGAGFTITNPNQPPRIVQLSALELQAMRQRGDRFELIDVRTESERTIASIDGARLLDADYHKALLRMDHDTPLVFQCHHGVRSQAAAEYFLQAGFTRLFNLRGGIDAWSQLVDGSVPRY